MVSLHRNASRFSLLPNRAVPSPSKKQLGCRALRLTGVVCSALTITTAVAGAYPERPVRVIVGFAPGGGPDVTTRIIVAELTRQMGRQFVVDNRPGATGQIGNELIARAAPDGYTLGNGNIASLAINRVLLTKLPYSRERDIQSIGQYGASFDILAVALSLPVKSVRN